MDITKLTVTELKALAFDTLVQIEALNKDLQIINQQIKNKQMEPTTENVSAEEAVLEATPETVTEETA